MRFNRLTKENIQLKEKVIVVKKKNSNLTEEVQNKGEQLKETVQIIQYIALENDHFREKLGLDK